MKYPTHLVFEESHPLDPTRCVIRGGYDGTDVLLVPVLNDYTQFPYATV